ncbi:hypothetical protein Lser_V15G25506 [Lactuca serriola]
MNDDENESSKRKKKHGTLDWFVNAQKKTKTQDDSSSTPDNITHGSTKFPYRERESQFDVNTLPHDPGLRNNILDYHHNDQDAVRKEYIQRGPCQPCGHQFLQTDFGGYMHRFIPTWFDKHKWLFEKEAAFCFLCYLFRDKDEFNGKCGDAFVTDGFKSWNMPNRFDRHVGAVNTKHNEEVDKVVLKNAPKNLQVTSPSIQKDIIHACAKETTKHIIREVGEDYFAILVDESADVTHNEQISLCLRYVDKKGDIVERFLGVVHVVDTTALSLKKAIYSLLAEYSLSPSKIRGQGYDEASNMKGESNGLNTLILKETTFAYYVHCFAHQLQLTLVVVSKKSIDCGWIFEILTNLLNVIGVSCKRKRNVARSSSSKGFTSIL